MLQHRKLIIVSLLLAICSIVQGQILYDKKIYKDVYFSIRPRFKENDPREKSQYKTLILGIDNLSNDTLIIENFNKYIYHKLDVSKLEKMFYWDFLTLSRQIPDDVIFINDSCSLFVQREEEILEEKTINIVIPPNSYFDIYIYIRRYKSIKYAEGKYMFRIYHRETGEAITEMQYVESDWLR